MLLKQYILDEKRMPLKNIELRKVYLHDYYLKNRAKILARVKEYEQNRPSELKICCDCGKVLLNRRFKRCEKCGKIAKQKQCTKCRAKNKEKYNANAREKKRLKKPTPVCIDCHNIFNQKNGNQKRCPQCQRANLLRKRRERYLLKKTSKPLPLCEICGFGFERTTGNQKRCDKCKSLGRKTYLRTYDKTHPELRKKIRHKFHLTHLDDEKRYGQKYRREHKDEINRKQRTRYQNDEIYRRRRNIINLKSTYKHWDKFLLRGKKWRQTDGGKKYIKRRNYARRQLGHVTLNIMPHDGTIYEEHHIDETHTVYIPKALHDVYKGKHNHHDRNSMVLINTTVYNWLISIGEIDVANKIKSITSS